MQTETVETTEVADEKIIERIRNLFAMSQDDSSPREAEIALKRYQSLMLKYGITEADLTTSEFGDGASFEGKTLELWRQFMSIGIAKFTDTVVTIETGSFRMRKIVFKGYKRDVNAAILMADYLEGTMLRSLKTFKKETGSTGKAASTSFKNSFASAVSRRMQDMADEAAKTSPDTANGTSLVVSKMKAVESEFGAQRVKKHNAGPSDLDAAVSGNIAGYKVNLNAQVSGSQQKALS